MKTVMVQSSNSGSIPQLSYESLVHRSFVMGKYMRQSNSHVVRAM